MNEHPDALDEVDSEENKPRGGWVVPFATFGATFAVAVLIVSGISTYCAPQYLLSKVFVALTLYTVGLSTIFLVLPAAAVRSLNLANPNQPATRRDRLFLAIVIAVGGWLPFLTHSLPRGSYERRWENSECLICIALYGWPMTAVGTLLLGNCYSKAVLIRRLTIFMASYSLMACSYLVVWTFILKKGSFLFHDFGRFEWIYMLVGFVWMTIAVGSIYIWRSLTKIVMFGRLTIVMSACSLITFVGLAILSFITHEAKIDVGDPSFLDVLSSLSGAAVLLLYPLGYLATLLNIRRRMTHEEWMEVKAGLRVTWNTPAPPISTAEYAVEVNQIYPGRFLNPSASE